MVNYGVLSYPWVYHEYSPAIFYQLRQIQADIARGTDCGIRAPFELTVTIPKKKLSKEIETQKYDLQGMPGLKVQLKYYPKRDGYTQIGVRVYDPENVEELLGVKAVARIEGIDLDFSFEGFDVKRYAYENYWFGATLAKPDQFYRKFKNMQEDSLKITVAGCAFIWDTRLMSREWWRFNRGISAGHKYDWLEPEDYSADDFQFIARNGRAIHADLGILAECSPDFKKLQEKVNAREERTRGVTLDYTYDVLETALQLCYDYSLAGKTTFYQKLELLYFFDQFKVSNYKEQVEIELVDYIDRGNVGRVYRAAIHCKAETLEKKAYSVIKDCILNHKFFLGYEYEEVRKMIDENAGKEGWPRGYVPDFTRSVITALEY